MVDFPCKALESVDELEDAGHKVKKIERKRALLRGMPSNFDVTVETISSVDHTYSEAVA